MAQPLWENRDSFSEGYKAGHHTTQQFQSVVKPKDNENTSKQELQMSVRDSMAHSMLPKMGTMKVSTHW